MKNGWPKRRVSAQLEPDAAATVAPARRRPAFPTAWARLAPVRALREGVQVVGVKNLLRKELSLEVYGLDELRQLPGPALIMANHASHLDTAVLMSTLPPERRRRTAVGIEADYFFDSWWRASGSAIVFDSFPIERSADVLTSTPARLLADGWTVVVFPEGTRSRDGFVGPFRYECRGDSSCLPGAGYSGRDPRHVRGDAAGEQLARAGASAGQRAVWAADHVPAG